MRFALFYHSLLSDWNHGNAHFLRGVAYELLRRGHQVTVYEPQNGWSFSHLMVEPLGSAALQEFKLRYQGLESVAYSSELDLDETLDGCDVVIVHEWTEPSMLRQLAEKRRRDGEFLLLFHDTHHRAVTAPASMESLPLTDFDGVLAFGQTLRDVYLEQGWHDRVFIWHEAADVRIFRPLPERPRQGDLVWIGNWGDNERTKELEQFLFDPVRKLRLRARVHGVRYPSHALRQLQRAGIEFGGWLPNSWVPELFSRHGATVHIPRRAYTEQLPGIPTIRVFEALACGIPLVSAPWNDCEGLFRAGTDYLVAHDTQEMKKQLQAVLLDPELAESLHRSGLETILQRHTCGHRVDELLAIVGQLKKKEVMVI